MKLANDKAIGGSEEHALPGTPQVEMKSKLGVSGRAHTGRRAVLGWGSGSP